MRNLALFIVSITYTATLCLALLTVSEWRTDSRQQTANFTAVVDTLSLVAQSATDRANKADGLYDALSRRFASTNKVIASLNRRLDSTSESALVLSAHIKMCHKQLERHGIAIPNQPANLDSFIKPIEKRSRAKASKVMEQIINLPVEVSYETN